RSIGLIALIFSVHSASCAMTNANASRRGSPGQARGLRSNAFRVLACFVSMSFAGLVVLARSLNPIPSRTRPLNSSAPMVLWLKPWESRSLPGLPRTKQFLFTCHDQTKRRLPQGRRRFCFGATVFDRGAGVFGSQNRYPAARNRRSEEH